MLLQLSRASLRHARRRLARRVRSAPILALGALLGLFSLLVLGPSIGARFGRAQAESIASDGRPLAVVLFVLAVAAGALTDWRARRGDTTPAPGSTSDDGAMQLVDLHPR